jgi:hypothetical protein
MEEPSKRRLHEGCTCSCQHDAVTWLTWLRSRVVMLAYCAAPLRFAPPPQTCLAYLQSLLLVQA